MVQLTAIIFYENVSQTVLRHYSKSRNFSQIFQMRNIGNYSNSRRMGARRSFCKIVST